MRFLVFFAAITFVTEATVEAGRPFRRNRQSQNVATQPAPVVRQSSYSVVPATATTAATAAAVTTASATAHQDDALAEVNAERAKRGLRPFLPDPLLNQAARMCASIRASKRIEGHLPNDFSYLPSGTSARSAGCGALEPSWGWGTCCTYDNYTYAGAAWVMGADGKRYMHLFVR